MSKVKIPFQIDRTSPVGYSDQLVEGIREAVRRGVYRKGERLPTWKEMAEALGVSARIPREAIAKLAREGLVTSHRRQGCIVSALKQRAPLKGSVLVILTDLSFSSCVQYEAIGEALARQGYAAMSLVVRRAGGCCMPYDLSVADRILDRKIDFVYVMSAESQFGKWLAGRHVPFAVTESNNPEFDSSVCGLMGVVKPFDFSKALRDMAAHCRRVGVKRVLQVCYGRPPLFDATSILAPAGVRVESWHVKAENPQSPADVRVAGFRAFSRRLKDGIAWLPEVLLFTDDYLASGFRGVCPRCGIAAAGGAGRQRQDIRRLRLRDADDFRLWGLFRRTSDAKARVCRGCAGCVPVGGVCIAWVEKGGVTVATGTIPLMDFC